VVRIHSGSVLFRPAPEGTGGKRKIGWGFSSTGINAWAREKELNVSFLEILRSRETHAFDTLRIKPQS
jgi:hypothetical protein